LSEINTDNVADDDDNDKSSYHRVLLIAVPGRFWHVAVDDQYFQKADSTMRKRHSTVQ